MVSRKYCHILHNKPLKNGRFWQKTACLSKDFRKKSAYILHSIGWFYRNDRFLSKCSFPLGFSKKVGISQNFGDFWDFSKCLKNGLFWQKTTCLSKDFGKNIPKNLDFIGWFYQNDRFLSKCSFPLGFLKKVEISQNFADFWDFWDLWSQIVGYIKNLKKRRKKSASPISTLSSPRSAEAHFLSLFFDPKNAHPRADFVKKALPKNGVPHRCLTCASPVPHRCLTLSL